MRTIGQQNEAPTEINFRKQKLL